MDQIQYRKLQVLGAVVQRLIQEYQEAMHAIAGELNSLLRSREALMYSIVVLVFGMDNGIMK